MATRTMLLAAFLFAGIVRADDTPKLSGSAIKLEDAAAKAVDIFEGEITEPGSKVLLPPTMPYCGDLFRDLKITVLQVYSQKKLRLLPLQQLDPLRGPIGDQTTVALFVATISSETRPKVGNSYIFFTTRNQWDTTTPTITEWPYNCLESGGGFYIALKLLPATDDNIAMVKKLVPN